MPDVTKISDLLSSAQVAELLGITQTQVVRAICSDKLKGHQVGRSYVIPRDAVDEFRLSYLPGGRGRNIRRSPLLDAEGIPQDCDDNIIEAGLYEQ